ncbi:PIG-L family deacetylase [uncultured Clostridium sp.]|uniref:PIG-L deacetylase family protein n=1 Tax=uncultured Clostridium sp. TaxID=59620 RepID=UPI0032169663
MAVILFISAHQDDETLSMGAAIINHVAVGHRVYSGCVTDGSGSGVRGTNGIPSDTKNFINARNTEMINSLRE